MWLSSENSYKIPMVVSTSNQDYYLEHIDQHLDQLFGAAMRLTRHHADAEDLVAETVTRAWAKIDTLLDTERFVPWLLCIMSNTFISETRRSRNKKPHISYVEESSDEAPTFSLFERLHQPFLLWWSNPEQEFLNQLLRKDVEDALDSLPEHFQIVMVLAEIEGLSYQEISDALEIPVGTVRSRLARARGLLQKALWQQAQANGLVPEDNE